MVPCPACRAELRPSARICFKCGKVIAGGERRSALGPSPQAVSKPMTPTIDSSPQVVSRAPPAPVPGQISATPSVPLVDRARLPEAEVSTKSRSIKSIMGFVAVVITLAGLYLFLPSGKETAAPIPASATSPKISAAKPTTDSLINTGAIKTVIAPQATAALLTEMLRNSERAVRLVELKGQIESEYPKPLPGDVKAARSINDRGLQLFRQGDYVSAAAEFSEALQTNPADVEILNNRAYALSKVGKFSEAERDLGDVLAISPGRTSGWVNLAEVYAETGRFDAAAAAYVVSFQFASNKEKALTFFRGLSESYGSEKVRKAASAALDQLSR